MNRVHAKRRNACWLQRCGMHDGVHFCDPCEIIRCTLSKLPLKHPEKGSITRPNLAKPTLVPRSRNTSRLNALVRHWRCPRPEGTDRLAKRWDIQSSSGTCGQALPYRGPAVRHQYIMVKQWDMGVKQWDINQPLQLSEQAIAKAPPQGRHLTSASDSTQTSASIGHTASPGTNRTQPGTCSCAFCQLPPCVRAMQSSPVQTGLETSTILALKQGK
jgi:hypothetical protein